MGTRYFLNEKGNKQKKRCCTVNKSRIASHVLDAIMNGTIIIFIAQHHVVIHEEKANSKSEESEKNAENEANSSDVSSTGGK